jgi:hypothetical protein
VKHLGLKHLGQPHQFESHPLKRVNMIYLSDLHTTGLLFVMLEKPSLFKEPSLFKKTSLFKKPILTYLRRIFCCANALLIALASTQASAETVVQLKQANRRIEVAVIGVDNAKRAAMLQRWVRRIVDATRTQSGAFALTQARIEVRELDSQSKSPVPWGQTERSSAPVKVLLYVRKDAEFAALMADWTAPHELAHLYHPLLGAQGRWLAEGFASYQQHRFMVRAGVINVEQAWQRLDAGFQRGEGAPARGLLADLSYAGGGTMRLYWAGAAFWLAADVQLRKQGSSLDVLMDRYLSCCMQGEISGMAPETFVRSLDRLIAGKAVLLPLYQHYAQMTAFPNLLASYQALGLRREGTDLRFDANPKTQTLRNAIMAAPGASS